MSLFARLASEFNHYLIFLCIIDKPDMTNRCFSSNYALNAVEVNVCNVLFNNTVFNYFMAVNITSSTRKIFNYVD